MGFDLQPTDEQQALKQMLHEFAADVLRPAARGCEADRAVPDDIARRVHQLGVTAPVGEDHGGGGELEAVTYCIAAEELAWGNPGIAYQALGSGLAAVAIGLAGTRVQQERYLPLFAAAESSRSFVAVGEKIAAGDLDSLETSIDGGKITGTKYGVLNAADARIGVVVGRNASGIAAAVAEPGMYEIVKPEDKIGLEAAPTSVVRFDGEGSALTVGPELDRAVLWAKLMTGAVAVGCARASFEHAAQYATEREAFGKPIGAFQGVAFKIADMAIEVDAARLSVLKAAWLIDRAAARPADVAAAVGQALSCAIRCGDDGVQVLGGHGYIKDHPVEMWFRDAVTLSVFDSPDVLGDLVVTGGG